MTGGAQSPLPRARSCPARRRRPVRPHGVANRRGSLSRQAISLLLHYPIVASLIPLPDALLSAELRGLELLRELHQALQQPARLWHCGPA